MSLPWIEKYRASKFEDILSHRIIIETLQKYVSDKNIPHMIFYGPSGTGKTSMIITCAKRLYSKEDYPMMVMEINASEERGIDIVRNTIIQFVTSINMPSNKNMFKLVILDEADALTYDAQLMLRNLIELYTNSVRFCLVCNYIKKIHTSIQSRCTCFRFSPLKNNYVKIRLKEIIQQESVDITNDGTDTIVKHANGDMRKGLNILQTLHMAYQGECVNADVINNFIGYPTTSVVDDIVHHIVNDKYSDAYTKILEYKKQEGYSLNDIITELYTTFINHLIYKKDEKITEDFNIHKYILQLKEAEVNSAANTNETLMLLMLLRNE